MNHVLVDPYVYVPMIDSNGVSLFIALFSCYDLQYVLSQHRHHIQTHLAGVSWATWDVVGTGYVSSIFHSHTYIYIYTHT